MTIQPLRMIAVSRLLSQYVMVMNIISRFCGLLQFHGQIRKKTLSQLLIFLCHKFPRVSMLPRNLISQCEAQAKASQSHPKPSEFPTHSILKILFKKAVN